MAPGAAEQHATNPLALMQGPQGADTNSSDRLTCMSSGLRNGGGSTGPIQIGSLDSQPRRRRQGDPDSLRPILPGCRSPLQPMQGPPSPCALHSTLPCGRRPGAVIPFLSPWKGWCSTELTPTRCQRHRDGSPFHRLGIDWVEIRDCSQTELSFVPSILLVLYGHSVQGHWCNTLHHLVYH